MKVVDQSGRVIDLPAAEAQAGLESGLYTLRRGEAVNVVDAEGQVGNVQPEELAKALGQGYTLATDDMVARDLERQKFTEVPQQLAAAAESAAAGATFGLSDLALSELGASTDDMRARREHNEGIALAGEVVGGLAPLLLTGGASAGASAARTAGGLAARGARALGAPARAVAKGAESAATAIEGALGGSRLARMAGGAAAGAIEGAAQGAGHALSESVLTDTELTAEAVLQSAGYEALLGGAIGGVMPLAVDAIAAPAKWAGAKGGKVREMAERRTAARELEATRDESITAITEAGTKQAHLFSEIAEPLNRGAKKRVVGNAIQRDVAEGALPRTLDDLRPRVDGILDGLDLQSAIVAGKVDEKLLQRVEAYGDAELLRRAKDSARLTESVYERADRRLALEYSRQVQIAREQIESAAKKGSRAQIFGALDDLKTSTGKIASRLRDKGLEEIYQSQYMHLADHLVDPAAYGRGASQIQQPVNEAWTRFFETAKGYRRRFLERGEGQGGDRLAVSHGFEQGDLFDPAKAKEVLARTGDADYALVERIFREHVDAQDNLVRTLAQAHGADPAIMAKVDMFSDATREMTSRIDKAKQLKEAAAAHAQTMDVLQPVMQSTGTFGTGVQTAVRIFDSVATSRAAKVAAETARKVLGAAKSLTRGGQATRSAARRVPGMVSGSESRQERFEAAAAKVRQASPEAIAARVTSTYGTGPVAEAITRKAIAASQHLQAKMPAPLRSPGDRQPHLRTEPAVTASEMARWLRHVDAANNPQGVIDAALDGTLTREAAETLRTLHPELYSELKLAVDEQITEADGRLPRSQLQQLSLLFNEPYHFSATPEFIRAAQASYAPPPDGQGQGNASAPTAPSARQPMELARKQMTRTQSLAE